MRRTLVRVVVSVSVAGVTGAPAVRGAAPTAVFSAAASCGAPAFGSPRYHSVGVVPPWTMASADFNGDGHADLVTASGLGGVMILSVLLADGLGGFGAATTTPVNSENPGELVVGDVNGDGRVDLLIPTFDGTAIQAALSVLLGDGTGSFSAPASFPIGAGIAPTSIVVADVDRDGDLDAVLTCVRDDATFAGTVHVLKGDGAGGFGPPTDFSTGAQPTDLTLADLNHDTLLDLAVVNYVDEPAAGALEIRLGDGTGGFGPAMPSPLESAAYDVAAGDFNEDGEVDLAIVASPPNQPGTVSVRLGDGTGHFGPPAARELPSAYQVEPVDVTGDGHLDLVASGEVYLPQVQQYAGVISAFAGDGSGGFGTLATFPVRGIGTVVADFDDDGRKDVAVAGQGVLGGGVVGVLPSMCGNVADLAISVVDSADPILIGQQATYTLQVVSSGPDAANATAELRLPAGLAFLSASASVGICPTKLPADRTVRCLLGDLTGASPGNAATVTIVARAYETGLKTVTGTAVTSVLDPMPANNVEAETTDVIMPGGADLMISAAPGGGVALNWTGGDAQAGYVIGRVAGGVETRFPATGMLPPDTTSYVDSTAVPGLVNCYQVAAMTEAGTGLALSQMLCASPGTASPPGALGDFRLQLDVRRDLASFAWSPFGGQTNYVLHSYTAGGESDRILAPEATSDNVFNSPPACYVLIPVDGTTPLANSTVLCCVPDAGTFGNSSPPTGDPFSSLSRTAAGVMRLSGQRLR